MALAPGRRSNQPQAPLAPLGERQKANNVMKLMAERGRFELPIPLRVCRISSAVQSTTLPPLRGGAVSAIGLIHGSTGDDKSLQSLSPRLVDHPAIQCGYPPARVARHNAARPIPPADGRHPRLPERARQRCRPRTGPVTATRRRCRKRQERRAPLHRRFEYDGGSQGWKRRPTRELPRRARKEAARLTERRYPCRCP